MTERSPRPVDHAGLQVLTYDECLRLAASEPVGRVAFADDGDVEVFPVNHCVVDGMVAFRVAEGSKLGAAIQRKVVAFEVDRYDRTRRDGWSVIVKGRAELVTDEQTAVQLQASGIRPWSNSVARPHWVAVRADEVSGRHL